MPSFSPTGGSGLTFDLINSTVFNVVQNSEQALSAQLSSLSENPTTADLLKVQTQLQQWTMTTSLQSTLVKEVGDALKGIVQKAA